MYIFDWENFDVVDKWLLVGAGLLHMEVELYVMYQKDMVNANIPVERFNLG